jgi:hypothetical protein
MWLATSNDGCHFMTIIQIQHNSGHSESLQSKGTVHCDKYRACACAVGHILASPLTVAKRNHGPKLACPKEEFWSL